MEGAVERYAGSSPLGEMIRYHFGYGRAEPVRRGKRLRPQLLLRVAVAEGADVRTALDPAIAVEILHNYSLVHDDIEDGDELRHGRRTVWAEYGVAHGINTGDALCALSYLTILNAGGVDDAVRARMARVLHEGNLAMCRGQALDISFETRAAVSMGEYRAMIEGKTAALFATCCELGALAAGASAERARAYAALGAAYGVAFQVRDDVLGTWGSPEVTGKPSGADIARRKWAFPVVWALEQPGSAARAAVAAAYAEGQSVDAAQVASVVAALDELGAREAADAEADRALELAAGIAREGELDRDGEIRDFLAQGARRVA